MDRMVATGDGAGAARTPSPEGRRAAEGARGARGGAREATRDHVRAIAAEFLGGRMETTPRLDAPDFDGAFAAVARELSRDLGIEGAIEFDMHLKAHAMTRHYELSTPTGEVVGMEATLFAIAVNGSPDALAELFVDAEALRGLGFGLIRRGVAHAGSRIALSPVPVRPEAAARVGPGAIARLNEAMFVAMVEDLWPTGESARSPDGGQAVAAAFGAAPRFGDVVVATPEEVATGRASRLVVGMRVLPREGAGGEANEDFFTAFAGDAEISGELDVHDPHEMWVGAARRELAGLGVDVEVPTTFTEAAAGCAARGVRDFLDAAEGRTGWPLAGNCTAVHVHEDEEASTLCFVRDGVVHGRLRTPMASIGYDVESYVEALGEALREDGEVVRHDSADAMPGVTAMPAPWEEDPEVDAVNDNLPVAAR